MAKSPPIVPVILSGGAGSRLWPISTDDRPKQFHALGGDLSMFTQTALRVQSAADLDFGPPIVVCGLRHQSLAAQALAAANIEGATFLLEPIARNTAPALAAAALVQAQKDPNALMLVLPADHIIARPEALRLACLAAAEVAAQGRIVTFAILPDGPETGYGYIKQGKKLTNGVYEIEAFQEKPSLEVAKSYVASGDYAWNAGIFFFKAATMIEELERHAPQIIAAAREAIKFARPSENNIIQLELEAFAAAPSKSIDYAVMEHTSNAAVIPVDMGWSDVGSFSTLWELGDKDGHGNVAQGQVLVVDSQGCFVRSDGLNVAVIGVSDIVVIATPNGVLVVPRDRAQDVRIAADGFKHKAKD
jgi:mannose-1-phosphate guanylyltransferase / mannose-6-phosphate isomerase